MTINCPACRAANDSVNRFCTECGKTLTPVAPAALPPVCAKCGTRNEPGHRFCVECGTPLGGQAVPPRPPAHGGAALPEAIGNVAANVGALIGRWIPPAAPAPAPAPPPAAPAVPANLAAAAAMIPPPGIAFGSQIRAVAHGDLYNNGTAVVAVATESHLVLLPAGGTQRAEEIPGLRHIIVGDYDGDNTQELAVFTDEHVWVVRYSETGSVPSRKVSLSALPDHLARAPFTCDGRTVLLSAAGDRIIFYVLHPGRGLVEIGATSVPAGIQS